MCWKPHVAENSSCRSSFRQLLRRDSRFSCRLSGMYRNHLCRCTTPPVDGRVDQQKNFLSGRGFQAASARKSTVHLKTTQRTCVVRSGIGLDRSSAGRRADVTFSEAACRIQGTGAPGTAEHARDRRIPTAKFAFVLFPLPVRHSDRRRGEIKVATHHSSARSVAVGDEVEVRVLCQKYRHRQRLSVRDTCAQQSRVVDLSGQRHFTSPNGSVARHMLSRAALARACRRMSFAASCPHLSCVWKAWELMVTTVSSGPGVHAAMYRRPFHVPLSRRMRRVITRFAYRLTWFSVARMFACVMV